MIPINKCLISLKCIHDSYVHIWNVWFGWGIEKFEDIKGVIRSRKSKHRQYNDQETKGKQRSTKKYTENLRSSNTKNPTQNPGEELEVLAPHVIPVVLDTVVFHTIIASCALSYTSMFFIG